MNKTKNIFLLYNDKVVISKLEMWLAKTFGKKSVGLDVASVGNDHAVETETYFWNNKTYISNVTIIGTDENFRTVRQFLWKPKEIAGETRWFWWYIWREEWDFADVWTPSYWIED